MQLHLQVGPADFARIHDHLKGLPPPARRVLLTSRNLCGAIGVFLIVFLSTLPIVVPFALIHDVRLAQRISDAIAAASRIV